jgi:hypothetical protein
MKSKSFLWVLLGLSMLLGVLLTACCSSPHSLAIAPTEEVALAVDLGWKRCPGATSMPHQGVGLGEPQEITLDTQDGTPIVSLTPVGMAGDLLIATAAFTERPKTSAEVPAYMKDAQFGLVTVDLATGQTRLLAEKSGGQSRTDGRYVVWENCYDSEGHYTGELHVYDLQSDRSFQVDTGALCPSRSDVANGILVWDVNRGRETALDIQGYDLGTGRAFTVADRPGYQKFARTDGDWIAYLEVEKDAQQMVTSRRLYVYRIETGEELELGPVGYLGEHYEYTYHTIDASRVAWVSPEKQIHIYDLNARQERVLPSLPVDCAPLDLALSGDVLLFSNSCCLYMGYHLSRDIPFDVSLIPPGSWERVTMSGVVVSGDRLAGAVSLNGEQRIYTAQIVR